MFKQTRRRFISWLAVGTTAIAAPLFWRCAEAVADSDSSRPNYDDSRLSFLTAAEYATIYHLADRIIPREGKRGPGASDVKVANRLDVLMATRVNKAMRADFREFLETFDKLSKSLKGRRFAELSVGQQEDYVRFWQTFPSLAIVRGGFLAVKRSITAAYFSTPESWAYIGYPGPRRKKGGR